MESIYHGLDTLLYTQDIIRLMSSSDVENLYNISVACNRLMKLYDQMIKIDESADDINNDGGRNEELFGSVSLLTRTVVTEARDLLPSLRAPQSGRAERADHQGVKTTDNSENGPGKSGGSEGTSTIWPRLERTSTSRLPDPRSSRASAPRVPPPPPLPSALSTHHHPRPPVTFAIDSTNDPQIDLEVAQNTGTNNRVRSSYDMGGIFAAFDLNRYMPYAFERSSRGGESADLEVAAIFPRGEKHV